MSWLSALLLAVAGVLLTIGYNFASGRHAERRELVREGSAVVTPVTELLSALGPESIMFGSDEQIAAGLNDLRTRWWDKVRPPLLEYANHHPRERVRTMARDLADAFGQALASTSYLLHTRNTATTMEGFEDAKRCKQEALAKAEELMAEVRKRWLR